VLTSARHPICLPQDVKPDNVLVSPERGWASKLADFGGTTRLDILGTQALVDQRGMTLPFVAPECLRRELPEDGQALRACPRDGDRSLLRTDALSTSCSGVAARSLDIYAYGLTLYMLWLRTGDALPRTTRHPFRLVERDARSDEALCAAVRDPFKCLLTRRVGFGGEQPGLPPGAPDDVRALMQSCWAHDPTARPSAADVATCAALTRAQNWRAVVTVTYEPHVTGAACCVRVSLAPEAAAKAETHATVPGTCSVAFSCTLTVGTECAVVVAPFTAGAHANDGRFLGSARALLLPVTPALAEAMVAPLPLAQCVLTLPVTRGQDAAGKSIERLAACVSLQRHHPLLAMPDVRLGTLSLALSLAHADLDDVNYDVMLSYCDAETGVARGGDGFAPSVCDALRAKGYTVYMFAERVREGKAWQDVRAFGLTRCAAFVALCSPTYGCLDHSPWSANELRFAFAERARRGVPSVVALWHTGKAPSGPGATLPALFCGQAELPDAVVPPASGKAGAECHFKDVMEHLFAALCARGVHPRPTPASA
jgi:hypothetical protein